MAVCAFLGIGAMLLFVTVTWPEDTRRYPITVFVASVIGFLTCAAIAVLAAARATYPTNPSKEDSTEKPHD
jgi:hypothetical protein